MGNADTRPEQAQVVVNLRNGAHRGTGVPPGRLLVNGDCRAQSLNGVHVRLVHLAKELAGIAGQALHIAALSFRIDRIEGQRTLSAAAQPRDDRHLVPRDFQGDILQVMLPGAPDL